MNARHHESNFTSICGEEGIGRSERICEPAADNNNRKMNSSD